MSADNEKIDNFLKNIVQMKNNSVLLKQNDDGLMELVFLSEEFAAMMESSVSELKNFIKNRGFYKIIKPEDRPLVRSMIRYKISYNG